MLTLIWPRSASFGIFLLWVKIDFWPCEVHYFLLNLVNSKQTLLWSWQVAQQISEFCSEFCNECNSFWAAICSLKKKSFLVRKTGLRLAKRYFHGLHEFWEKPCILECSLSKTLKRASYGDHILTRISQTENCKQVFIAHVRHPTLVCTCKIYIETNYMNISNYQWALPANGPSLYLIIHVCI